MLRSLTLIGSVLTTLLSTNCVASLSGFLFQEPETDTASDFGLLLEELASPKVSGEELASVAEQFRDRWQEYMTQRGKMASAVADLASFYEQKNRFSEALALYESLWEHFPEQQELIGKIKRDRALAEIPIDLSTPEKAFLSLQRSLFAYKITAATFGIAEPSAILYEPEPIERHEWEAAKQRLESRLAQPIEGPPGSSTDSTRWGLKVDWPKPVRNPWRDLVQHSFYSSSASLGIKEATALETMDKLVANFPVPVLLTPAARTYLAELSQRQETSEERFSAHFEHIPAPDLLKYILDRVSPKRNIAVRTLVLNAVEGRFALHMRHLVNNGEESPPTVVLQDEPCVPFPDNVVPFPIDPAGAYMEFILDALGFQEKPASWLIHKDDGLGIEIMTLPRSDMHALLFQFVRFPKGWRYYGCVLPLFRCLRAYPLPGPPADRYGDPKKRYVWDVQLGWQVRRIQRFLDDRGAIVMLLSSHLVGQEERSPDHFIPRLDLPRGVLELASRLGLWYDGKAYRFLLFDSEEDREQWLKGKDWLDMPSDLDDHEWPTEEEFEKKRKEVEKNAEQGVFTIPDLSDE